MDRSCTTGTPHRNNKTNTDSLLTIESNALLSCPLEGFLDCLDNLGGQSSQDLLVELYEVHEAYLLELVEDHPFSEGVVLEHFVLEDTTDQPEVVLVVVVP